MRFTPFPTAEPPEFQGHDDADLLEFIALRDEDPALGDSACRAFYNRHTPYLYGTLYKFELQLGGEQGVRAVVVETLERAFHAAHTFSKNVEDDEEIVRAKVRAWLNAIAKNVFRMTLRGRREDLSDDVYTAHKKDILAPNSDEEEDPSPQRRLLNKCLEMLPEKQRGAVLLSYQFYDETREHNRLTNEEARDIAHVLETTTVNLRQLRSRGERRLRECIEAGGTIGGY